MAATLKAHAARMREERLVDAASCLGCDAAIGEQCLDSRGKRTWRVCGPRYTFGKAILLADLSLELALREVRGGRL